MINKPIKCSFYTTRQLHIIISLIIFFVCKILIVGQEKDPGTVRNRLPDREPDDGTVRVVFYNCENLFDYRNDPGTGDDDFAVDGIREWSFWKYRRRLIATARVLLHAGGWNPPDLIGLAEIENRRVLHDLLRLTPLSHQPYGIIHFESPDPRGIDVALLYHRERFIPHRSEAIRFNLSDHGLSRTRDILYVNILTKDKDTFHLFVNHWPSRFGGHLQTIPKRIAAAERLASFTDSILDRNNQSRIIICGDFNDSPSDSSLHVLTHRKNPLQNLVNLMDDLSRAPGQGSHKHAGSWGFLDQILVSQTLLADSSNWYVQDKRAWVLDASYLLEKEERNPGYRPYRAFAGISYQGGFSDHLPVFLQLKPRRKSEPGQLYVSSQHSPSEATTSRRNRGKRPRSPFQAPGGK